MASVVRPTIVLTERMGGDYHLDPPDLDFLLAEHRAHLKVAPTGRRHIYRLTPAGHIGTIVAPQCRLVIQPKLPFDNLLFLLDPTVPESAAADHVTLAHGDEIFNYLAARLARLLTERAAAGLHRAYVERAESSPFLQGRLDLSAQLRTPLLLKDRFQCCYEEFTVDVPCNQVAKAAGERVLKSPLLCDAVRSALQSSLAAFAGVDSQRLEPGLLARAEPDPLTEVYRPLLELSRLLMDGLTRDEGSGANPYPAFLIDMERVFERAIASSCRHELARHLTRNARWTLAVQPLYGVSRGPFGGPNLQVRPDLVFFHRERPVLVLDAKWKRLPKGSLITADVYQALAYCAALGTQRAVLVYPGRRDRVWDFPLERSPIHLTIRTLKVVGARAACARSLRLLARRMALRRRSPGASASETEKD